MGKLTYAHKCKVEAGILAPLSKSFDIRNYAMQIKNKTFVLMSRKDFDRELQRSSESGYSAGYKNGYEKGKKRLMRTPGWLRDEIHKKLDLMFKNDNMGNKARYRWLKKHSLTTSHMSEMNMSELVKVNELLDSIIGKGS